MKICTTVKPENVVSLIPQSGSPRQVAKHDWRSPQWLFKGHQSNTLEISWQCFISEQGWQELRECRRKWSSKSMRPPLNGLERQSNPHSWELYKAGGVPGGEGMLVQEPCFFLEWVLTPSAAGEQSETFSPEVVVLFFWYFGLLCVGKNDI